MEARRRLSQELMHEGGGKSGVDGARPTELSQRIAGLKDLTGQQLRAEWRRLYRGQPPRLSRDLLIRSIAYRMQELVHGGLSKAAVRKLASFSKELERNGSISVAPETSIRVGARLVREWRGKTHTVTALDEGFEYAGKAYGSLSKIAYEITGAHWSGPRFFGLRRTLAHPGADRGQGERIDG